MGEMDINSLPHQLERERQKLHDLIDQALREGSSLLENDEILTQSLRVDLVLFLLQHNGISPRQE